MARDWQSEMGVHRLIPFLLLLFCSQAAAQPPGEVPPIEPFQPIPPVQEPPPESQSYMRTIAGVDVVAGAAVTTGALLGMICFSNTFYGEENDHASCPMAVGAFVGGFGVYAIGSPVVHMTRGNPGRALASLALRVGLPAAAIAMTIDDEADDSSGWLILGTVGGAMLFDWMVLARPGLGDSPRPPPSMQPAFTPTRGGATLGLGGVF